MAQLTVDDEIKLRQIAEKGSCTPDELSYVLKIGIPRMLKDIDYARQNPDRPLIQILSECNGGVKHESDVKILKQAGVIRSPQ